MVHSTSYPGNVDNLQHLFGGPARPTNNDQMDRLVITYFLTRETAGLSYILDPRTRPDRQGRLINFQLPGFVVAWEVYPPCGPSTPPSLHTWIPRNLSYYYTPNTATTTTLQRKMVFQGAMFDSKSVGVATIS